MGNKIRKEEIMLSLFDEDMITTKNNWKVSSFSANDYCDQTERRKLEEKYWAITEITDEFNRQIVSYQLSKKDCLHRWLKYKEGFSAELVRVLLNRFGIKKGQVVLDPFMGSGTTALVCCLNGINSVGWDILPMSKIAILAKTAVYQYDIYELNDVIKEVEEMVVPDSYKKETPYISITQDGYPTKTAIELSYYTDYFNNSKHSDIVKNLITLCLLNTLELVSFSVKQGQYLGWDYRCPKIIRAVELRKEQGKKPFATRVDKGIIPDLKETLLKELKQVVDDVRQLQHNGKTSMAKCNYYEGSVLFSIPSMKECSIDGVITSPPYCNRYDYTRTYGMELAYLGKTDQDIIQLRQELLSCTVESKTKVQRLKDYYSEIGRLNDYESIYAIIKSNKVLQEINNALSQRNDNGEINNKGVLRMVDGYFTELGFLFAELQRVCKKGSYIAFVNDNVRYAGEVIPVDFLCTELAENLGLKPVKIITLKQQKGNSSQQMAKYGRVALRKSITIWQKV